MIFSSIWQFGAAIFLVIFVIGGWRRDIVAHLEQRVTTARKGYLIVASAMLVYIVIFGAFTLQRHIHFNSAAYDLGIKDQVVWNIAQGNGFASSFEVSNFFGDHVQPYLALFAPFYRLYPSVYWLLVGQTILCASAAIPLYQLALRRLRSPTIAAILAVIFLLQPAVGYINRFDFHAEVVAIPLLLWSIVSAEKQQWGRTFLLLIATLLAKEDSGLTVAALGVWIALWQGQRKLGFSVTAIGIAYSLFALFVWIPAVRDGASDTLGRYGWLGDSPLIMIQTLLTQPRYVLTELATVLRLKFVVAFFAPYGFLPLLHPFALTFAPVIGYNFLSQSQSQHWIHTHYYVSLVPLAAASTVFALSALQQRGLSDKLRNGLLLAMIGVTLFFALFITPPLRDVGGIRPAWERQPNAAVVRRALTMIPDEAAVFTTNHYAPHLTHRTRIQISFSAEDAAWLTSADFALFNLADHRSPAQIPLPCQSYQRMLTIAAELGYGVRYFEEDVILIAKDSGDQLQLTSLIETMC